MASAAEHDRPPPGALLLFFSGVAALVYQAIWIKQLALVVGVDVYAVTTGVSGFFAGLALGSAGTLQRTAAIALLTRYRAQPSDRARARVPALEGAPRDDPSPTLRDWTRRVRTRVPSRDWTPSENVVQTASQHLYAALEQMRRGTRRERIEAQEWLQWCGEVPGSDDPPPRGAHPSASPLECLWRIVPTPATPNGPSNAPPR